MFQLDNNFLEEIGLGGMSPEQKEAFKSHMQDELETRVGARMSEGLTSDQVAEFERIIDGDTATIQAVLDSVADYKNDEIYRLLVNRAGFQEGSAELDAEFASVKWLTKNRPDYQQIVSQVSSELRDEIISNKDQILN